MALRVSFVDDDGEIVGAMDLTEAGTQKRLAVYLVSTPEEVPGISKLGPDVSSPEFTLRTFSRIVLGAGGRHL